MRAAKLVRESAASEKNNRRTGGAVAVLANREACFEVLHKLFLQSGVLVG